MTASDNVKLANFGLVRELTIGGFGMAVASEITEDFRFTLLYVAPEVLKSELGPANPKAYEKSSDLWALGCTLIEMLTKFPPYFEFYDENINFYNDFISCTKNSIENQLPYDSMSLIPSSSFSIRFLINKIFDKNPTTRITANGLVNFLKFVDNDFVNEKNYLEMQFSKALDLSSNNKLITAQEKRNIFKSIKQISIQSFARIRSSTKKTESIVEDEKSEKSLNSIEEETTSLKQKKKRKRHKKPFFESCWFCLTYCIFRLCCFTGKLIFI